MAEERTEAGRNGSRGALAAFGALALVASVAGAAWWFGFVPDRTLVQPRLVLLKDCLTASLLDRS